MKNPLHINKFLGHFQHKTGTFSQHITEISTLADLVSHLLPEKLAQHCIIANIRDGLLILHTDSATAATQLRYQQQDLLEKLRLETAGAQITEIQVKVRPEV